MSQIETITDFELAFKRKATELGEMLRVGDIEAAQKDFVWFARDVNTVLHGKDVIGIDTTGGFR